MLMTFYVVFILILTFLITLYSSVVNDSRSVKNLLLGFLMYLPLYGRVLGWW